MTGFELHLLPKPIENHCSCVVCVLRKQDPKGYSKLDVTCWWRGLNYICFQNPLKNHYEHKAGTIVPLNDVVKHSSSYVRCRCKDQQKTISVGLYKAPCHLLMVRFKLHCQKHLLQKPLKTIVQVLGVLRKQDLSAVFVFIWFLWLGEWTITLFWRMCIERCVFRYARWRCEGRYFFFHFCFASQNHWWYFVHWAWEYWPPH